MADINTPLPHGGVNFTGFRHQRLSGSQVAFVGNDTDFKSGIYTTAIAGGPVSLVANAGEPLPGGQGTFTRPDSVSIDGDNISFLDFLNVSPSGAAAVYARINGTLTTIAAPGTVLPGPGGTVVEYCQAAAISGDSVAFIAHTTIGDRGIFVWRNGQIQTVIRSGGQLGGINASVFDLSTEAFDGTTLAFGFYDGTGNLGGIYTATIPAPAAATCLALAGLFAARRRR